MRQAVLGGQVWDRSFCLLAERAQADCLRTLNSLSSICLGLRIMRNKEECFIIFNSKELLSHFIEPSS